MRFRKKPVVVEAVRWEPDENGKQVHGWPAAWRRTESKCWPVSAVDLTLFIETLEGTMKASPGDWIIRGVAGEFYPCKPDIFAATYEPVPADGKE